MPRPGGRRVQEKSKDFFGSMKRLLSNLKPWKILMFLSLTLAMISAILALIVPNKLSNLTDEIGLGLAPRTENLEKISTTIASNFTNKKIEIKMQELMSSKEISDEDKNNFFKALQDIKKEQDDKKWLFLSSCSYDVLVILFDNVVVNNEVVVSNEDLALMVTSLAKYDDFSQTEAKEALNSLPTGIKQLSEDELNIETIKNIANIYSSNNLNEKKQLIMDNNDIVLEDKEVFIEKYEEMNNALANENVNEKLMSACSYDIMTVLFDDITIDGVDITSEDLASMVMTMSTISNYESEEALAAIDNLPKSIYSLIEPQMNVNKIKKIAIITAIIYIISALFNYIQSLSMTTVSNKFAKKLRTSISRKINLLPLKFFDTHETGDILSRVTNDIDTIAQNLNNSLSILVSSITLFIGSVFMMFYTNWIMAITAIIASLLGFVFMFAILGKSQKYFNENQRSLGELNGYIEENYSGHNVVKAYNGVKEALNHFENLNNNLYQAKRKSIFLSGTMQPMMAFIGNLGFVAVCIVGSLLTMNGNISFGVIVAFILYVRLFTNPLSQIAQAMTNLQSTAAASERVFEFLDETEMSNQKEISRRLDKSKVKGNITFNHVKFGYDKNKMIIKDFSVDVKAGQKIAIVGPTGAGKTTMVNLLMKFYEINDGDILIDGVSTKELSRENIHELFCMVLQDTWLFEGTIGENIRFNKENISDREVLEACQVVGIDHFVKTLPGGLNAIIGDTDTVSQGQKQLFTIARGSLEDAPFLILDEATSNVDTRTEELVQKAMDKLTEGRTSFIIAHRLSTIKNADLILVMNEGNIIEQGTHDELMKQKGFYEKLYNSQFEKMS